MTREEHTAVGVLELANATPALMGQQYFLGVKDRRYPELSDVVALSCLARFLRIDSADHLTSLDYFVGVDHIEDVLGR